MDTNSTFGKWAHATNSKELLRRALHEKIPFIEADVSLGTLELDSSNEKIAIPIMAHPPDQLSDLSLADFLHEIVKAGKETSKEHVKVVKLDFKTIDVVEESLRIAKNSCQQANFELWLNADILVGPVNRQQPSGKTVNADRFLQLCRTHLPTCTLSLGWVTDLDQVGVDPLVNKYSQDHVTAMLSTLTSGQCLDAKLTFPVRAVFAGNSREELDWLLERTSIGIKKSSLTIWGQDQLNGDQVKSLKQLIESVGKHRIYLDISNDAKEQLFQ